MSKVAPLAMLILLPSATLTTWAAKVEVKIIIKIKKFFFIGLKFKNSQKMLIM
jgi:hypothetical protein